MFNEYDMRDDLKKHTHTYVCRLRFKRISYTHEFYRTDVSIFYLILEKFVCFIAEPCRLKDNYFKLINIPRTVYKRHLHTMRVRAAPIFIDLCTTPIKINQIWTRVATASNSSNSAHAILYLYIIKLKLLTVKIMIICMSIRE